MHECKPLVVGTPEELDAACGKFGLCVVAFVGQEEGVKKEADEAVMEEVAQDKVEKALKFVYVDPAAQHSFAAAFEVRCTLIPKP